MFYLGIDQHHKQITICLKDKDGNVIRRRQVSTQPDKIKHFFTQLNELVGEHGFMACLEVCGFNDWLIKTLHQVNCREIVLIHPERPSKHKTDRRDAAKLAELLWINGERLAGGLKPRGLRRVLIPDADDQQDRQLTALRKRVGQQRTRTINKVKNILRRHNLTWQQPTKTFQTKKVQAWLKVLELPDMDRLEMDQLLEQWELWDRQLLSLEARLKDRFARHKDAPVFNTAPGVSSYSGLSLASRIGDIRRFPRPRSLANYFGLTPGCRNSGESQDRLGSITKEGSGMARFILGQLVLHALKKDPHMRAWYQKIRRRRGSKIARVAVMRRLVTILWHMLTHREPYCCGGPPRARLRTVGKPAASRQACGQCGHGRCTHGQCGITIERELIDVVARRHAGCL